jgi:ectoine hydroxylase-related dioxygenase (phytanoyl-CoA dioxygenase family)
VIGTSGDLAACRRSVTEEDFAVIPAAIELAEVDALVESLQELDRPRSRAGIRHLLSSPTVAKLAHDSRLGGIAQEILGPEAFPFRATLFDKSPDSNWLIPWHQDTALPLMEKREVPGWGPWSVKAGVIYAHAPASALNQILALRLHLDDCSQENGPLRVLPGSHTTGVLNDDQISQLAAQGNAVECVVPKGGVLAMRPLIVHSSSKSHSNEPRRVLHIEYAAQRCFEGDLQLAIA